MRGVLILANSISITGLVVLGGNTSIADPGANFRDSFAGTTGDANGLVNALVRITFSYQGFQNCFNVMNEIKDPVKTIKRSAPLSLLLVAILYMLCNVAYFAAVPKADIMAADTTTASLFFSAVFGEQAAKGLNMLVILSAFGNLVTVLIGQSRLIREIGRQGVLPYPKFWVTTKPFGTPIGPYLLKWGMTVLMIVAPPAGDAFNFGEFYRIRDHGFSECTDSVYQWSTFRTIPSPCSSSQWQSASTSSAANVPRSVSEGRSSKPGMLRSACLSW